CMFLLSLTATCQVCTVSLKAGLSTYNGFACRALDPPDGDPTQTDADIMRVARQAPPSATGRLVLELKAKSQHAGQDTLEKGRAIRQEVKVSRFVLEINGDSTVRASLASGVAHGASSGQMVVADDAPRWGYDCTIARGSRKVSGSTTKLSGM